MVALIAALLAQGGGLEVAEVVVVAMSGAAGLFIGKERRWSAMAAEVVGQRARRGGFNGVGAGWASWSGASVEDDGMQGWTVARSGGGAARGGGAPCGRRQ